MQFKNNVKTHLTENTRILSSEVPVRRYVQYNAFGYFRDYRICHDTLTLTTSGIRGMQKISVTPQLIDQRGLIGALTSELSRLEVYLMYNNASTGYHGFILHFRKFSQITKIECSYAFAWFMNIITSYGTRNTGTTNLVLYDSTTNLIGFNTSSPATTKILFPLVNRGINKLTVSSDALVMSQYVNGHKTATLDEIVLDPAHGTNFLSTTTKWTCLQFFYTLQKHLSIGSTREILLDVNNASAPSEYPDILPDCISTFHCSGIEALELFNFVVTK